MKMRSLFWLLLGFTFLLGGCSSNHFYTNPEFKQKDCSQMTLTLLPFPKTIVEVENARDVPDDFPQDKRFKNEVIRDSLWADMNRELVANISCMNFIEEKNQDLAKCYEDSTDIRSGYFKIKKDSILAYYPTDKLLQKLDVKADFVIVVTSVDFDRSENSSAPMMIPGPGGGMVGGGGSFPSLEANVTFVIWDVHNHIPVRYGEFTAEASFFLAMTQSTWHWLFQEAAKEITNTSSFRKVRVY